MFSPQLNYVLRRAFFFHYYEATDMRDNFRATLDVTGFNYTFLGTPPTANYITATLFYFPKLEGDRFDKQYLQGAVNLCRAVNNLLPSWKVLLFVNKQAIIRGMEGLEALQKRAFLCVVNTEKAETAHSKWTSKIHDFHPNLSDDHGYQMELKKRRGNEDKAIEWQLRELRRIQKNRNDAKIREYIDTLKGVHAGNDPGPHIKTEIEEYIQKMKSLFLNHSYLATTYRYLPLIQREQFKFVESFVAVDLDVCFTEIYTHVIEKWIEKKKDLFYVKWIENGSMYQSQKSYVRDWHFSEKEFPVIPLGGGVGFLNKSELDQGTLIRVWAHMNSRPTHGIDERILQIIFNSEQFKNSIHYYEASDHGGGRDILFVNDLLKSERLHIRNAGEGGGKRRVKELLFQTLRYKISENDTSQTIKFQDASNGPFKITLSRFHKNEMRKIDKNSVFGIDSLLFQPNFDIVKDTLLVPAPGFLSAETKAKLKSLLDNELSAEFKEKNSEQKRKTIFSYIDLEQAELLNESLRVQRKHSASQLRWEGYEEDWECKAENCDEKIIIASFLLQANEDKGFFELEETQIAFNRYIPPGQKPLQAGHKTSTYTIEAMDPEEIDFWEKFKTHWKKYNSRATPNISVKRIAAENDCGFKNVIDENSEQIGAQVFFTFKNCEGITNAEYKKVKDMVTFSTKLGENITEYNICDAIYFVVDPELAENAWTLIFRLLRNYRENLFFQIKTNFRNVSTLNQEIIKFIPPENLCSKLISLCLIEDHDTIAPLLLANVVLWDLHQKIFLPVDVITANNETTVRFPNKPFFPPFTVPSNCIGILHENLVKKKKQHTGDINLLQKPFSMPADKKNRFQLVFKRKQGSRNYETIQEILNYSKELQKGTSYPENKKRTEIPLET